MTWFIATAVILFSMSSQACDNIPDTVDGQYFYAEIESKGQMSLKFNLVLNQFINKNKNIKVFGGEIYDVKNLPGCDTKTKPVALEWETDRIATHWTHDQSYFTSMYRICLYNHKGEPVSHYDICNSEVGD